MLPIVDDIRRRELFPVTRRLVYLAHGRRGPLCAPALEAMRACLVELSEWGGFHRRALQERAAAATAAVARFIGAEPDEMCVQANSSEAVARIVLGIDWRPGDHAVAPGNDYPSVTRPLQHLRSRGVDVTFVEPAADGAVTADALLEQVRPRTRLVAASHVSFATGYRLDAAALCRACRERGVWTLLDLVQSAGALRVDVRALGCDFAVLSGRKWMLGSDALGFLYARGELAAAIAPLTASESNVAEPWNLLVREQSLARGAARHQLGSTPLSALVGLEAALALLASFGTEVIEQRILALALHARGAARRFGLEVVGEGWPARHVSGIVALRWPAGAEAWSALHRELTDRGWAIAGDRETVRISPHIYNTAGEIDDVLAVVARTARGELRW